MTSRDTSSLADAIELGLLLGSRKAWSDDEAAHFTGAREQAIALALTTVSRRRLLLNGAYPFRATPVGVQLESTSDRCHGAAAYLAMLLLASPSAPWRTTSRRFAEGVAAFESLVVAASSQLLGTGAKAIRFGWPSVDGRPREFSAAVRWLARTMDTDLGIAYRPPRRQDGGVDVIAWRPFPDRRRGFPTLLVQATVEQDYVHKSRDIDLRTWAGWLALDTDPMTALAIPYHVIGPESWNEMSARTIVLDRIRLAGLVVDVPEDVATWVEAETAEASRLAGNE